MSETKYIIRLVGCAIAALREGGILTQCSVCWAYMEGREGGFVTPAHDANGSEFFMGQCINARPDVSLEALYA